jgi:hypothetical protein
MFQKYKVPSIEFELSLMNAIASNADGYGFPVNSNWFGLTVFVAMVPLFGFPTNV